MKKIAFIIFSTFFLFSCEEVIEIEVHSGLPKLVIDATFEVFTNESPASANTIVKLSSSANYFDEQIPAVSNATVFLTNLSDNSIINFSESSIDGNYKPVFNSTNNSDFIPEDNTAYELTVIYNNEVFKGRATKVKTPNFSSVEQGTTTLFTGKETEVKVTFTDDETQENFYLFDFSKSLYTIIEDRFFNGSEYNFSFFYKEEEIELPLDVVIKMSGISKEYFTYFRVLVNQSRQGGGGPFQTIPASLLGNMVNTSDSKSSPLGYFHISETATYNVSLVEKN